MNRPTTLLAAVLFLFVAPPAHAATFQEGQLKFTVSGSWTASGPTIVDCHDRSTGESDRDQAHGHRARHVQEHLRGPGRPTRAWSAGRSSSGVSARRPRSSCRSRAGRPRPPAAVEPRARLRLQGAERRGQPRVRGSAAHGRQVDLRFDFAQQDLLPLRRPVPPVPAAGRRPGLVRRRSGKQPGRQALQAAAVGSPRSSSSTPSAAGRSPGRRPSGSRAIRHRPRPLQRDAEDEGQGQPEGHEEPPAFGG